MVMVGLALVAGLALLTVAPDRFVAGSAGLADRWGLSRIVIGAVVIGFGTSAPELVVSGLAAADGEPEVGVGNIIGSNMANLSLVVGVAALIGRIAVPSGLLRRELPLVLGATALFALLVQNGLTRYEGVVLAVLLVVVLVVIVRGSHVEAGPADAGYAAEVGEVVTAEEAQGTGRMVLDAGLGLLGTLVGAQLLVTGAVEVASELDLSGGFVGITIVAIGTSLPELVTAVAASRVGEQHLIIGNVVGSNIFNCLAVGGLVGLVGPSPIDDANLTVGAVALMLGITALGAFAMTRGQLVGRADATVLLLAYLALMPLLA